LNTKYTHIISNQALLKTDCCSSPGGNPIPLQLNQEALKMLRKRYNHIKNVLISILVMSAVAAMVPFCSLIFIKHIIISDSLIALLFFIYLYLISLDLRHQIAYSSRLYHRRLSVRLLQYCSFLFILFSPGIHSNCRRNCYVAFSMVKIG